jgi:hypothetical protein
MRALIQVLRGWRREAVEWEEWWWQASESLGKYAPRQ